MPSCDHVTIFACLHAVTLRKQSLFVLEHHSALPSVQFNLLKCPTGRQMRWSSNRRLQHVRAIVVALLGRRATIRKTTSSRFQRGSVRLCLLSCAQKFGRIGKQISWAGVVSAVALRAQSLQPARIATANILEQTPKNPTPMACICAKHSRWRCAPSSLGGLFGTSLASPVT
jgi:hypothetical protein